MKRNLFLEYSEELAVSVLYCFLVLTHRLDGYTLYPFNHLLGNLGVKIAEGITRNAFFRKCHKPKATE